MNTQFELPFPPSVNNLFATSKAGFRNGLRSRRRFCTPRYLAWRREAELSIMAARVPEIHGPVEIKVRLEPPDRRRRDADNCSKALLDALVRMHIIEADDGRIVRSTTLSWGPVSRPRGRALITVSPV